MLALIQLLRGVLPSINVVHSLRCNSSQIVGIDDPENLINKNIYPTDKEDLKVQDDKEGSSLSAMGLKPKIVH